MSNKPNSIIFVSLSGIGNFLMHTPAIKLFKEEHPDWQVAVCLAKNRKTASIAKVLPYIDEVINVSVRRSLIGHWYQIWQLRRRSFTTGVVLYPGQRIKSAIYLWLAGIEQRVGHRYPLLGNPDSGFLLTQPQAVKEVTHDVEQNTNLLKNSGLISDVNGLNNYELKLPEKYEIMAEQYLQSTNIATEKIFVGMHAGSNSEFAWKRWPTENFATLGKYLVKKGYHILLFGDKNEMKLNKIIRQRIGKQNVSIVSAKLLVAAAIIRKCGVFISNDSGLMHLAAAVGCKTMGIFGPTDEARTGPRGDKSQVIRAPGSQPVYDVNNNFDLGSEPHETLDAVTPQMVIAKIIEWS